MIDFKEQLKTIVKKHNLPSFETLDKEFEFLYVGKIIEVTRPLSFIRRRMSDKMGGILGMLQGMVQPNPSSMISLEESSFFTKEEKQEKIIAILRELMYFERLSIHLNITSTDEEEVAFIKALWEKWNHLKPQILELTKKLHEGWRKDSEEKKDHNYMG